MVSLTSTLERLSFSHCDDLVDQDFFFLPSLNTLKSLRVSSCHGINGTLCALLPSSLLELTLHECQNLKDLSSLIPNLPGSPPSSQTLPRPPALTHLDVSGCKSLSSKGLDVLPCIPTLRHLRIAFTSITDEATPFVTPLRGLTSLDLTYASLTDKGIPDLASLASLSSLDLGLTSITDESISLLLSYFPYVHTLSLFRCKKVTGKGFAPSLQHSTTLTHNTLTKLDMGHCVQLNDEGVLALSDTLPSLLILDIPGCKEVTRAGLSRLSPSLNSLNLAGCKIARFIVEDSPALSPKNGVFSFQPEGEKECDKEEEEEEEVEVKLLAFLAPLTQLRQLHLHKVTNIHLEELVQYPCARILQSLHLSESQDVNDEGLDFILTLKELRHLHLKDCRKLSLSGLKCLIDLPYLRVLHLPRAKAKACRAVLLPSMDSLRIVGL